MIVLKIILLVPLFIFLAALLVLLIVLLCPLTYKISAKGKNARILVKWLGGLVSFRFEYKDGTSRHHLGLPFYSNKRGKNKKNKEKKQSAAQPEPERELAQKPEQEPKNEPEQIKTKKTKEKQKKKHDKKHKKTDKKESVLHLISRLYNHPERKPLTQKVKLLLKRLFRALKPKEFSLKGEIGLADPYETGRLIGALAALSPVTGPYVQLKGRFDEEVFDITLKLCGSIALIKFVWPVLAFALTNPMRKIIKQFIKPTKGSEENE